MKVKWNILKGFKLDSTYGLLTARSTLITWEVFTLIDWKKTGKLDDIQFAQFLVTTTDLTQRQAMKVFDIFDLDRSGSVEFDEFYLLVCILTAVHSGQSKQFMYQNWRTCFEILDADGSKAVSRKEFETLGFLFNFTPQAVRKIYKEFDVSADNELDHNEFKLFVLAAMDLQAQLEAKQRDRGPDNVVIDTLKKFLINIGVLGTTSV